MTELASPGQLRAAFTRWALVLVPGMVLLGFLSGRVASSGPDNPWFASLVKPAINPPSIAFPIVWTLLYVLMGVALAMIVSARGAPGRGVAIVAFLLQLALNLAWSPTFFGAHQITTALWIILALDVAVLVTIILFARIRPLAAWLLVPYLAWILFASLLNWEFLKANPDADGREVTNAVTRVAI